MKTWCKWYHLLPSSFSPSASEQNRNSLTLESVNQAFHAISCQSTLTVKHINSQFTINFLYLPSVFSTLNIRYTPKLLGSHHQPLQVIFLVHLTSTHGILDHGVINERILLALTLNCFHLNLWNSLSHNIRRITVSSSYKQCIVSVSLCLSLSLL